MGEEPAGPNELRFSRTFAAPRALVFACMTDPDHLTHFWGPVGTSAPRDRIRVDARPGGVFETVMVNDADGNEYATHAVYEEVRSPEVLAWTERPSGMRVRAEFVELGQDRTEVRIHQTKVPAAMQVDEARAGFLSSLDRFEWYLAGLAAGTRPTQPKKTGISEQGKEQP
jgi:uncharacterized protein YndB with AHSA1/START domain